MCRSLGGGGGGGGGGNGLIVHTSMVSSLGYSALKLKGMCAQHSESCVEVDPTVESLIIGCFWTDIVRRYKTSL